MKDVAGKPRLSLVPPSLIQSVGEVMTFGADKYNVDSWREVEPELYRDALMRHLCKYLEHPDSTDEESGLPHLWHIATNVAFLIELEKENCY